MAASVAPFVRAVAAWMARGGRPHRREQLAADDLVCVAYSLQQSLQLECAEVAADGRDRALQLAAQQQEPPPPPKRNKARRKPNSANNE